MLFQVTDPRGVSFFQSPCLEKLGVPHAFSTRLGGVSAGPFESLNLGNPGGAPIQDTLENLRENSLRLAQAVGLGQRHHCWVQQVHGHQVVEAGDFPAGSLQADALVSSRKDVYLSIRIADCVPILLSDGRQVAAIHAGWRGVVSGVVAQTLGRFSAGVVAAIGPCIGWEAFEVGPEVAEEFRRVDLAEVLRSGKADRWHVDLQQAVRLQLQRGGVLDIDGHELCTFRDRELFYSHRREEGLTGRLAAIIGMGK